MTKKVLFVLLFAVATNITKAQTAKSKGVDNFDFGLSVQHAQFKVRSGLWGLGLDFFFNKAYASLSYVGSSGTYGGVNVTLGLLDLMGGYKVIGGKGVEKGFYVLGGFSSLGVTAEKGSTSATVSAGAGFTAGLLYKYKHFYGTAKYNFKLTSLVLGVGFSF